MIMIIINTVREIYGVVYFYQRKHQAIRTVLYCCFNNFIGTYYPKTLDTNVLSPMLGVYRFS